MASKRHVRQRSECKGKVKHSKDGAYSVARKLYRKDGQFMQA